MPSWPTPPGTPGTGPELPEATSGAGRPLVAGAWRVLSRGIQRTETRTLRKRKKSIRRLLLSRRGGRNPYMNRSGGLMPIQ